MAYITPRVQIQQEFEQLPVYSQRALSAFIIGPHYHLARYGVAAEKYTTALSTKNGVAVTTANAYQYSANTTYDIPNVPLGGDVDPSYTKVYLENAISQYFPHDALGTKGDLDKVALISGGTSYLPNRLRFKTLSLVKTAGQDRSAILSKRDVAVGDYIDVSGGDVTIEKARVTALLPDITPSVVEDVTFGTTNAASHGASIGAPSRNGTGGSVSGITAVTTGSTYFGYASKGVVSDTYTVEVTTGAVNASLASAKFTITSAKGVFTTEQTASMDATSKVLVVDGSDQGIGNNNVIINFTGTTGDLAIGTKWDITVYAAVTPLTTSTFQSSGTYIGTADMSYKVVVAKGGAFYDPALNNESSCAILTITASDIDSQTTVSPQKDTVFSVGQLGVSAKLTSGPLTNASKYALIAGDTYFIPVTAAKSGAVRTVQIDQTIPAPTKVTFTGTIVGTTLTLKSAAPGLMIGADLIGPGVLPGTTLGAKISGTSVGDLDSTYTVQEHKAGLVTLASIISYTNNFTAKLYLAQPSIEIPSVKNKALGYYNWLQSGSSITINKDITTYDSSLVTGSTPVRLDVVLGDLYVEHRDLLQDHVSAIDYVESASDVTNKLNTIDPDNPLAQAVYDALLNSGGQRVYFLSVNSDDLVGYLAALKISEKSDQVYSFVPLTFDREVQDAVVAHVNAFSTPEIARWRIAWLSIKDETNVVTYDNNRSGVSYKATVTENLALLSKPYTYVTVEGADFLADDGFGATKLRTNDIMRINFTINPDGEAVYDEYLVDHVLTNNTFVIATPVPGGVNPATKVQLVRSYTKTERARNIAAIAKGYNNRRVRVVFPDTYKDSKGVSKPGYVAAAGLAGLRSGVVPHQGLTNTEFLGVYSLSKVVIEFGQAELDVMAAAGVWIITQSVIGSTAYVRHQLTTDTTNLNTSEDSITTNVDNMSYALRDVLAPFIGRYNINNENISVIRAAISDELAYRATNTATTRAGNQLTSFSGSDILSIGVDPVSKDKINASVRLHLPYPLNYVTLKLIGGV